MSPARRCDWVVVEGDSEFPAPQQAGDPLAVPLLMPRTDTISMILLEGQVPVPDVVLVVFINATWKHWPTLPVCVIANEGSDSWGVHGAPIELASSQIR